MLNQVFRTLSVLFALTSFDACIGRVGGEVEGGDNGGDDDRVQGGVGGRSGGTGGKAGAGGTHVTTPSTIASASRLPRLTHFQYRNAVRDLLRLPTLPTAAISLQADAVLGFDNNNRGKALDVSFELRADYERFAEGMASYVVNDKAALSRLIPQGAPSDLESKARSVITSLATRAYRRPVSTAEVDELWRLFQAGGTAFNGRDPFAAGMEILIGALLQSPLFLYRPELGEGSNEAAFVLTQNELATRLAFALTDSMPDDQLLAAAQQGKLKSSAEIRAEAQRMLTTPAARESAQHFHEQLFRITSFEKVSKDSKVFPSFSASAVPSLKEEARLFLDDVVATDQNPSAILLSSTSFVDKTLAGLYGLATPPAEGFAKTELNAKERGGLLTQIGFLAANAGAIDPDPIHRGVFISEVLLCKTLPPPAMNVPPVPASGRTTNRQRVEAHTGKGTCGATCHATLINPLGYAFEGYDAIGRFRTKDNGVSVDSSGSYSELTEGEANFQNALDLTQNLSQSRDFHACYVGNWMAYLWSRTQRDEDQEALSAIVDSSLEGASVKELLLTLVTHPSFARFVP